MITAYYRLGDSGALKHNKNLEAGVLASIQTLLSWTKSGKDECLLRHALSALKIAAEHKVFGLTSHVDGSVEISDVAGGVLDGLEVIGPIGPMRVETNKRKFSVVGSDKLPRIAKYRVKIPGLEPVDLERILSKPSGSGPTELEMYALETGKNGRQTIFKLHATRPTEHLVISSPTSFHVETTFEENAPSSPDLVAVLFSLVGNPTKLFTIVQPVLFQLEKGVSNTWVLNFSMNDKTKFRQISGTYAVEFLVAGRNVQAPMRTKLFEIAISFEQEEASIEVPTRDGRTTKISKLDEMNYPKPAIFHTFAEPPRMAKPSLGISYAIIFCIFLPVCVLVWLWVRVLGVSGSLFPWSPLHFGFVCVLLSFVICIILYFWRFNLMQMGPVFFLLMLIGSPVANRVLCEVRTWKTANVGHSKVE
eukprot:GHVT01015641.1.p1 GENE.GHVT01015641.1~~GHVT01015641.1.p1  ORF type:complete len:419 (-),score=22.68 GHVT01015641.1:863-2119(-)